MFQLLSIKIYEFIYELFMSGHVHFADSNTPAKASVVTVEAGPGPALTARCGFLQVSLAAENEGNRHSPTGAPAPAKPRPFLQPPAPVKRPNDRGVFAGFSDFY